MGHLSFYTILAQACFQQAVKKESEGLDLLVQRCRGRTNSPNEESGLAVYELSLYLYSLPFQNAEKTEAVNFTTRQLANMVLNLVVQRVRSGQLVVLVDDVARMVSRRKRALQEKRLVGREKDLDLKGMPAPYNGDVCALVDDGLMRSGDLEKINVRRLISCAGMRQMFNAYLCTRARALAREHAWPGTLILDLDFGDKRQPFFVCTSPVHKEACGVLRALPPSTHGEGEQVAVEWLRRMALVPSLQHQTAVLRTGDKDALLLLLTQFRSLEGLNLYWQPFPDTYLCIRGIFEALAKADPNPDPAELAFAFIAAGCDYVEKKDCSDGYGAADVYAACRRVYPRHQKIGSYGDLLGRFHLALRAVARRKLKKVMTLPPAKVLEQLAWTHEYLTHARDRDLDVVCIDI